MKLVEHLYMNNKQTASNFIDSLIADGFDSGAITHRLIERKLITEVLERDFSDSQFMINPAVSDFVDSLVEDGFEGNASTYKMIERNLRKLLNKIYS